MHFTSLIYWKSCQEETLQRGHFCTDKRTGMGCPANIEEIRYRSWEGKVRHHPPITFKSLAWNSTFVSSCCSCRVGVCFMNYGWAGKDGSGEEWMAEELQQRWNCKRSFQCLSVNCLMRHLNISYFRECNENTAIHKTTKTNVNYLL